MSPRSRQQFRAVLKLRELVLAGEFRPGERVPELSTVARLGMSRTPVRLALLTLAQEGLLEVLPNGGFVVRDFTVADVTDAIELRGVLEGTAARFAAERHSDAGVLEPLREAVLKLDEVLDGCGPLSFDAYVEWNAAFHGALLKAAGSPMLERAMDQAVALPFASPNAFLQVHSEGARSLEVLRIGQEHHRVMLEAIGARQGARAEAVAREHARLSLRNLNAVLSSRRLLQQLPGGLLVGPMTVSANDGAPSESQNAPRRRGRRQRGA